MAEQNVYWVVLAVAAMGAGVGWHLATKRLGRILARLAVGVRAVAHGETKDAVETMAFSPLAPLPDAINELCAEFASTRKELARGLEGATRQAEDNAAQLAAVLNGLYEGVIVCNLEHQVVLYNQVAKDMLAATGPIGLLRPVFDILAAPPIRHKLADIQDGGHRGTGAAAPFLAGSADGRKLLQTRMTPFFDTRQKMSGYVLTFTDAGGSISALARLDGMFRDMRDEMEERLERLSRATPATHEQESNVARATLHRLTDKCRRSLSVWCPVTDVLSTDLFEAVQARTQDQPFTLTLTGLPVWLRAEPQSLALALAVLAGKVAAAAKTAEIDLAADSMITSYTEEVAPTSSDEAAWVELVWTGERLDDAVVERWMACSIPSMSGMRVKDVLAYHGSAHAAQRCENGRVHLWLPLRKGREPGAVVRAPLPSRPEFYDMSLLTPSQGAAGLGERPLKSLTYVVFDTETTGLDPSGGDEIVQIGGIRVVNGRILTGESFETLVNPLRPIPAQSIQYHGITDQMVKDQPTASTALPRFHSFVAQSILVAHNAAFDLKFLHKRSREAGVSFDNPILDTMLLSAYLDGPDVRHSLDAICERYGIEIAHRHTALGDALVTAAVLLRQIDALAARGITTYAQAVGALNLTLTLHHRQQSL